MSRPADVCRGLLAALDVSEGRRKRRARDTAADAIGLGIKRTLLTAAVHDDPEPEGFEGWLLDQCLGAPAHVSVGATRAMAREILAEWRLAEVSTSFTGWLDAGAPSDDRAGAPPYRDPTVA
jgi:hypothetical protein